MLSIRQAEGKTGQSVIVMNVTDTNDTCYSSIELLETDKFNIMTFHRLKVLVKYGDHLILCSN
jgi:hypothetical protein